MWTKSYFQGMTVWTSENKDKVYRHGSQNIYYPVSHKGFSKPAQSTLAKAKKLASQ